MSWALLIQHYFSTITEELRFYNNIEEERMKKKKTIKKTMFSIKVTSLSTKNSFRQKFVTTPIRAIEATFKIEL